MIGKKIWLTFCILFSLYSCSSRTSDQSNLVVSMQIIDRNGFTETTSNKDRLAHYKSVDFLAPQPYQKVLRVFGRNRTGQNSSKVTSYHDNGHLWQYLEIVDSRAHGSYQEWFPNGQIKIEARIIEGMADIHDLAKATWVFDGTCKVWDEQGNLSAAFTYEKGLLQSQANYYFLNGKPQKIIPYHQGKIHGISQVFDEKGNVVEEVPYVHGEKEGTATAFWAPGQLLSKEIFNKGYLINASYYDPSGQCIAEIKEGSGKQANFLDHQ